MRCLKPERPCWKLSALCLSVVFLFFSVSFSDPRISESGLFCGNLTRPPAANYIPTFVKEMENLSQAITTNHFATHQLVIPRLSAGNSTKASAIYALAQCHQDLSPTDCLLCFAASRTRLPHCLPSVSARIFLDGCFLRYDTYRFYNESVSDNIDTFNCSREEGLLMLDEGDRSLFMRSVVHAVGNASETAEKSVNGFGAVEVERVYALAQCWESVVESGGCRECLQKAAMVVRGCGSKKEGRAMNTGCFLRYSTYKFYNNKGEEGESHGLSGRGFIIAIVLAIVAVFMLSLFGAYAGYAKITKKRDENNNLGVASTRFHKSNLKFKYETLEKATDYFSASRKIGQGGAGSVFMGILPNGKTVAVKRLVFNTRQWVDEFFNEVNLIYGIQHKNLVKLLGCSIEGPESLLVYEYVQNKSLDQFIFDENKAKLLTWKQKLNVITGTAEGLAYLHGGCHVRIIHRDIKGSNVLLDENLNPKIADFGLARCFAADKTHLSTGVAGTLGYMAPEYLLKGQLTEKADIYSFGILVLEIVCGRRNNSFTAESGSLLQTVWKLHRSNRLAEAVDPSLRHEPYVKEICHVLQIGLLCTQATVSLRPSMKEVNLMLTNRNFEIPVPSQPPFLNIPVLEPPPSSIRSNSTSSLVSTQATRVEALYTSSDSYSTRSSYEQ